jgi:hypothetical protein
VPARSHLPGGRPGSHREQKPPSALPVGTQSLLLGFHASLWEVPVMGAQGHLSGPKRAPHGLWGWEAETADWAGIHLSCGYLGPLVILCILGHPRGP